MVSKQWICSTTSEKDAATASFVFNNKVMLKSYATPLNYERRKVLYINTGSKDEGNQWADTRNPKKPARFFASTNKDGVTDFYVSRWGGTGDNFLTLLVTF